MPSSDIEALVRDADPARTPTPEDELDALVRQARAITAHAPVRKARRRPRRALIAVPVAAAALLVALPLALNHGGQSLAAKAYAATDPGDEVVHEVSVWTVPSQNGPQAMTDESWYRPADGTARRIQSSDHGSSQTVIDSSGVMHSTSPWGTDTQQLQPDNNGSFRWVDRLRSLTLGFRQDFEDRQMQDAGATTFEGRPVHAYSAGAETYYVDSETTLPIGMRFTSHMPGAEDKPEVTTIVVKTYEKLPPTPENLAKLK